MDIEKLLTELTLEEKASLLSGADFWHTKAAERLGIPAVMVSDGPHGLRKQDLGGDHLGVNESIKAVCFPAACASAASFDRDVLRRIGEGVGDACQHEDLSVILGPAVNIKRSPLCGRNFEYFSEDPYLTGELACALIDGVQSRNVGTSIKHFAANSQEHRRMSSDSVVDERTLREIYFPAFETAVKRSKPWTVMCSYNRVNGEYASQNRELLTDILRDEWGFDGLVVSDWGAVSDRVKGVAAGLDLEMPGSNGLNDQRIVEAVRDGRLDEADVDACVRRVLELVARYHADRRPDTPWDMEAQHRLAGELAAECMVLLKNEDAVLPFRKGEKVAVIGKFAEKPRCQGGGSSHINSFRVDSLLDALQGDADITYAKGYETDTEETDQALLSEAVKAAAIADKVVIVAGLPDSFESEGYDRSHMRMPVNQNALIACVAAANPNTVVVLYNGSPVEMPWADSVKGVIEAYLGGQAIGSATKAVLWGEVNPCGRLPESFPIQVEDNPSYLSYGGEGDRAVYSEGIFVGYRYYDKKMMQVRYPFGYGLSYTEFAYSDLRLMPGGAENDECGQDGSHKAWEAAAKGNASDRVAETAAKGAASDHVTEAAGQRKAAGCSDKTEADSALVKVRDVDGLTVSVDVTNTGECAGKEVVQLYISAPAGEVFRPVRELKGFEKIALQPGETRTVTFKLDARAFAYWDVNIHDWFVESGIYKVQIARSSRDVELEAAVEVTGTREAAPRKLTPDTILLDLQKDPQAMEALAGLMARVKEAFGTPQAGAEGDAASEAITDDMQQAMMNYMPLRGMVSFGGLISYDEIAEITEKLNREREQ